MIHPWQQSQWQLIRQLIETERLPHAMLLLGNNGLGKLDFSFSMANAVLCSTPTENKQACGQCKSCLLLEAKTHPDLYYLTAKAPATSKSKNPVMSIRIDDVRELCEKLTQTSQYGGYRVAIIDKAELLTISAANSLLKTLEEPGQNVLMVLNTSRPHRLPITIRSRCQLLRFTKPDESAALEWLSSHQQEVVAKEQLQLALKYADGAPLAALNQLAEVEHHQILSEAMMANVSGKNSLEYAAQLTKFGKVSTLEGMLTWVSDLSKLLVCGSAISLTNEEYREKLLELANKANKQKLFRFQDQINFNLLHSSIALNEQLLWENLLLSWDNV